MSQSDQLGLCDGKISLKSGILGDSSYARFVSAPRFFSVLIFLAIPDQENLDTHM
jgi:hypothetical protein